MKKIIYSLSALIFILVVVLFTPFGKNIVLNIMQNNILHRELVNIDYWQNLLNIVGIFSIIFAIVVATLTYTDFYKKIITFFSDTKNIVWYCAIGSVLLFIMSLISKDLWLDESISLYYVNIDSSLSNLLQAAKHDLHPPLHRILLYFWCGIFGSSTTSARIFSCIPLILNLIVGTLFFKKEFGCKTATIFLLLFFSSTMINYCTDIRMYQFALLFCTLSVISSYYAIKNENYLKYLIYLSIFAVLGAYTHHFAALTLFVNFCLVGINLLIKNKKNIKNLSISALLGGLLYLPWFVFSLKQADSVVNNSKNKFLSWIDPLNFNNLSNYLQSLSPGISLLPFAIIFSTLIVLLWYKKEKKEYWQHTLYIVPILIVIFNIGFSFFRHSILVVRYMSSILPFVLFFLTVMGTKIIRWKKIYTFTIVLFLCLSLSNLYKHYKYEYDSQQNYNDFMVRVGSIMNNDTKIVLLTDNTGNLGSNIAITETYLPGHIVYQGNKARWYRNVQYKSYADIPENTDLLFYVSAQSPLNNLFDNPPFASCYISGDSYTNFYLQPKTDKIDDYLQKVLKSYND